MGGLVVVVLLDVIEESAARFFHPSSAGLFLPSPCTRETSNRRIIPVLRERQSISARAERTKREGGFGEASATQQRRGVVKHWGLSDEEQWNTHRSLVPLSGRENIHPTTDQWTGMGQQPGKNLFWEVIEPEIECQREDGQRASAGGSSVMRSGGNNAVLPMGT